MTPKDGGDEAAPAPAEGPRPAAADLQAEAALVGTTFDEKFLLQRLIGVGGFGAVYAARDLQLDCGVAIKVLRPDTAADERRVEGFLDEVRRLSRLTHPNIVEWKTLARTKEGVTYFVMELLEGRELESLLRDEQPLPPRFVGRILLQVLDALRAAHNLPGGDCLLHLDLKPANIFLEPPRSGSHDLECVKVIDFGVSQYIRRGDPEPRAEIDALAPPIASRRDGETITLQSTPSDGRCAACTPEYAAPEQGEHLLLDAPVRPLDQRADLYALGVIAFRMLTGKLPFRRTTTDQELVRRKLDVEPPPLLSLAPRTPRALARFVDRCLRRDPADRYATSEAAHDALRRILERPAHLRSLAVGASVALVLLLGGLLALPSGAAPRLELYESRDGSERLLTREVLYLGTATPDAILRVAGTRVPEGSVVRVVADPRADAPPIPGWSVRRTSETEVSVRGDAGSSRRRETAYLEVSSGTQQRFSEPFELAWLPKEGLRLHQVDVPGRGARRVDPRGLALEIAVLAPADSIATAEVRAAGAPCSAELDPTRSDETISLFRLPLEAVVGADDACDATVRVIDRAGNEARTTQRLELAPAPLRITDVRLLGSRYTGGRYVVHDPAATDLEFELNSRADVVISLVEDEGGRESRHALRGVERASLPLRDLRSLPDATPFSGRIEISAEDAGYVLRDEPTARGTAARRLPFFCDPKAPKLAATISDPGGAHAADWGDAVYFSGFRGVEIHVVRENLVPLRLAAFADGATEAIPASGRALLDPADRTATFEVPLSGPGSHRIVLRGWRDLGEEGLPSRAPDLEMQATCVVDETAPTLEWLEDEERSPAGASDVEPTHAKLRVGDDAPLEGVPPTPVRLHFSLLDPARSSVAVHEQELARLALPGDVRVLALPIPDGAVTDAQLPDGSYVARIRAVDLAGNESAALERVVALNRAGPTLEVLRPAAAPALWQPDASGAFEIRLMARDANGVASARATITAGDAAPIPIVLACDPASGTAAYSEWSGRGRIPRSWMNRALRIECVAADSQGAIGRASLDRDAASIDLPPPPRVRVRVAGHEAATMRFVRGNTTVPYVFGGRSDEVEERLFEKAGLRRYNPLRLRKSWEVAIPAGELRDYYLDETEVSAGEFLAFVTDPSGYSDPRWWEGHAQEDPERGARWEESLRDFDQAALRAPVVGVDWDEANAFARWSGKRLPSFVEWEYALRGGVHYRAGDSAHSASDDAPDSGIASLARGVSEWSSTPGRLADDERERTPAELAAAHPERYLAPWRLPQATAAPTYWLVGGSARSRSADFTTAEERDRGWSGTTAGFRCAADAEEVVLALELRPQDRPWFSDAAELRR